MVKVFSPGADLSASSCLTISATAATGLAASKPPIVQTCFKKSLLSLLMLNCNLTIEHIVQFVLGFARIKLQIKENLIAPHVFVKIERKFKNGTQFFDLKTDS
jgi:hypothetical protein